VLATVFVGVLGSLVTVFLYRKQQQRKSLTYAIKVTQLVSVHSEAQDHITIFYEGEQIERVHLVEVPLENSGNVPIIERDFERPLVVELGEGAEVLTVEAPEVEPSEIEPVTTIDGTSVTVSPLLLNPGDTLAVKLLVGDFAGEASLHSRIVGIKQLTNANDQDQRTWKQKVTSSGLLFIALLLMCGLLGWSIGYATRNQKTDSTVHLLGGKRVCAKVLRTGADKLTLQLSGSGKVISVPLSRVVGIKDSDC
jgi:hypothetical protein